MEVKIIKNSKYEIEIEIEHITIAEILRVYLNKNPSVDFVAWKREHSTENPILKVKTEKETAKKVVNNAIKSIEKDLDKTLNEFKSLE
jgi:DNA-directed RNA polymerase subunit L